MDSGSSSRATKGPGISTSFRIPANDQPSRVVLLACVVAFVALSLDHLSVFPPVGEDEPWIAAAPYKLATQGVYGSDLFAGYYGVERHNYQHMPLYPLLQAALFKSIGVGVIQMRLLPLLFGLALLLTTFLVGSRVADGRVGAMAVLLLLVLRIAGDDNATGILLLDRARINRYDIAVPVFGLLAFLAFLRAGRTGGLVWFFVTGILTGLASLSHLFGMFWLSIFVALALFRLIPDIPRVYPAVLVLAGFAIAWLPWLIYIATGWDDFLGQMRFVSPRFDLLNPAFYGTNILHGGGPISIDWLWQTIRDLPFTRGGAWIVIVMLPLAASVMLFGTTRDTDCQRAAQMLAAASLAQLAMFVTLLSVKTVNYTIGIWPVAVLLIAWLLIRLWDRRRTLIRVTVVVLVGVILSEGMTQIVRARAAQRHVLSYDWYTSEIARCISPGSRVLGLPRYWLGLRQFEYRTWLMAVNSAHPLYYHEPMTLDAALERIDPDIILMDRDMTGFFQRSANPDHPLHAMQEGFEAFIARRRAEPICAIRNRTYGTMSVYRVARTDGVVRP